MAANRKLKVKEKNGLSQACVFCKQTTQDEITLGGLKSTKQLSAHYYCLLFSETIKQSGQDNQGILGFMHTDILNELRQSEHKKCCYCKKVNASSGCVQAVCNRKFHFSCGLANNTQYNFNNFTSLCHVHRKITNIPVYIKRSLTDYKCVVCLEYFDSRESISNLIWANCCKSDIVVHLPCMQQLALNAGYFTKCPGCNNKTEFITTVKSLGVFVPERDASWELERNAFSELLYVHNTCDAVNCICPRGRNHVTPKGQWKLIRCKLCGSSGTHISCSITRKEFVCAVCKLNTDSAMTNNTRTTSDASSEIAHTLTSEFTNFNINEKVRDTALLEHFSITSSSTGTHSSCASASGVATNINANQTRVQDKDSSNTGNLLTKTVIHNLSDSFNDIPLSADYLKSNEENIIFDETSQTSRFLPTTVSLSIKNKIHGLESGVVEQQIWYNRKKYSSSPHKKRLKTIESEEIYLKRRHVLTENSDFGETSRKHRSNRKSPSQCDTLSNIVYDMEKRMKYVANMATVKEEVFLMKTNRICKQNNVDKDNNTNTTGQCNKDEALLDAKEYNVSLDTNSEVEFVSCPDANVATKDYFTTPAKTATVKTRSGIEVINTENSNKIVQDNEWRNSEDRRKPNFKAASNFELNEICRDKNTLDKIRQLRRRHLLPYSRRIVNINFNNLHNTAPSQRYCKLHFRFYKSL